MHSVLAAILFLLSRLTGTTPDLTSTASTTYESLLQITPSVLERKAGTALTLSTNSSYVLTNTIIPLKIQGGTAPYTFSASVGNLLTLKLASSDVYYQAPPREGVVILSVTDSKLEVRYD